MTVDNEQFNQLQDLSNRASRSTVAVIDAVTQRGGFKGEELSTIGQLRDQCIQIIQLCETLQQEAASADVQEAEVEVTENKDKK
tara:strand:+ start:475 stop:726 length:252 start_codon:yes stop_codon:yes gene_type:complete